jgi:hypothetical protein
LHSWAGRHSHGMREDTEVFASRRNRHELVAAGQGQLAHGGYKTSGGTARSHSALISRQVFVWRAWWRARRRLLHAEATTKLVAAGKWRTSAGREQRVRVLNCSADDVRISHGGGEGGRRRVCIAQRRPRNSRRDSGEPVQGVALHRGLLWCSGGTGMKPAAGKCSGGEGWWRDERRRVWWR